jgi:hypothetical protein
MAPIRQEPPKLWRVRGIAADGLTVTLGRYETEDQAKSDRDRFVREGLYREIRVDAIPPRPEPVIPPPAARK